MNDSLLPELPGFDDPIGMLKACHQRMLSHCELLEKLVPHIASCGVDDEARNAIGKVKTYFSISAVHHHQDEEVDLFPTLIDQSLTIANIIHQLRQQHKQIDRAWDDVFTCLASPSDLANKTDFPEQVALFCRLHKEHIAEEESELLLMAQQILSQAQLDALGNKMAKRRSVKR